MRWRVLFLVVLAGALGLAVLMARVRAPGRLREATSAAPHVLIPASQDTGVRLAGRWIAPTSDESRAASAAATAAAGEAGGPVAAAGPGSEIPLPPAETVPAAPGGAGAAEPAGGGAHVVLAPDPLEPPVLVRGARAQPRSRGRVIELDLWIDEGGRVRRAVPAPDTDAALAAAVGAAAQSAAFELEYRPAHRGPLTVAVWTREAFVVDSGGRARLRDRR